MKKVAFHNLGCKVNSYELDGIIQTFQKRGYEIVDFAQKADIYIVNTCTVTNIADRKSRQMLHRAKTLNPKALVVALGCYVQTNAKEAAVDEAIDLLIGNNEKSKTLEYVEAFMEEREAADKTLSGRTVKDLSRGSEYEDFRVEESNEHTRAYIKIQDGCDQFCSYCAIPLARGRVRSRSIEDTVEEIKGLAANGYKEIVLTGIHLSSYGLKDAYNIFAKGDAVNTSLIEVIKAVAAIDGIERIRLGSLEPRLITDDFLKGLTAAGKVCPHFHLSLQSGCDSVLKRMNRQYTAAEYKEKAELIRKYFDHPAITTDIIVGFPGESEEEFEITRRLAGQVNLYEAHIFKYSRRRGTAADKMPGQLTDREKSKRSDILIREGKERRHDFVSYYIGKRVEVLGEDTEEIEGKSYRVGYTREYVKCALPLTVNENDIVSAQGERLIGEDVLLCGI